jgi:hypothetical protein
VRKLGLFLLCLCLISKGAVAQGAAPEMFGVREIVIELANLDDPKTAETCGLSRDNIAKALALAFSGTGVPAIAAADAKPPSLGVARITLIPEVYTYTSDSLDCISWVSLTAQNHVNAVIPPVSTLRSLTILYWQQHTRVVTGESLHQQRVSDVLQRMAAEFARQYTLDQPPEPIAKTSDPTTK